MSADYSDGVVAPTPVFGSVMMGLDPNGAAQAISVDVNGNLLVGAKVTSSNTDMMTELVRIRIAMAAMSGLDLTNYDVNGF